jgi:hypothetical protein
MPRDRVQRRLRRPHRYARAQLPEHAHRAPLSVAIPFEWNPNIRRLRNFAECKTRRQHADHVKIPIVEADRFADHVRVSSEAPLKQRMAQNRYVMLVRRKASPEHRNRPRHREQVRHSVKHHQMLRVARSRQIPVL